MSLIITNKKTLGKAALITLSNIDKNLTSETKGDLTIISSGDQVVGLNVQNFETHFKAEEGAHTINDEQVAAIAKLGYVIEHPESKYIIGEILSVENHPKSDRLEVLKINIGKEVQIVTNLPGVKVGDKVVVATPGATHTTGYAINAGKLVGVQSEGIICGGETLGKEKTEGAYSPTGNVGDKFVL